MRNLIALVVITLLLAGCSHNACDLDLMPDVKGAVVVDSYLSKLKSAVFFSGCDVEGSYLWYLSWYQERVPRWNFLASMITVATILLAAAIPVVSQLQDRLWRPTLILSILGALIVVIQGVSEAYKFERAWQGFVRAKMQLELSHAEWQLEVIKITMSPRNDTERLKALNEATLTFVKEAKAVILQETEGFYENVELDLPGPNQTVQPTQ